MRNRCRKTLHRYWTAASTQNASAEPPATPMKKDTPSCLTTSSPLTSLLQRVSRVRLSRATCRPRIARSECPPNAPTPRHKDRSACGTIPDIRHHPALQRPVIDARSRRPAIRSLPVISENCIATANPETAPPVPPPLPHRSSRPGERSRLMRNSVPGGSAKYDVTQPPNSTEPR